MKQAGAAMRINDVIFTFSIDDGHPLDMKMAEMLERHGLKATFFIPVRNQEGQPVLDKQALRQLASRFEIGSHTRDHCFLKDVDIAESHHQITEGKKQLEDLLGAPVEGFCYPGGKYRRADAAMVQSAGFRYARTTMNLCFDTGDNPYEMPTTFQFYPHERSVYLRNFARGGHWGQRREALRLALQNKDWIGRLRALFHHACDHGGVFHLWAHSNDIDALQAWDQLDTFLAEVASNVPPSGRLDNGRLAAISF
jgi:peptidoglycan/xylan/chitin deacetylase (PgdA/CDA1 family)